MHEAGFFWQITAIFAGCKRVTR